MTDVGSSSVWMPSSVTLHEGDEFEAVLPWASLSYARTGDGRGSHLHNLVNQTASLHRFDTGFPMDGVGQMHGDTIAVQLPLRRSSTRTVMQGRDLSFDELIIYGPDAEHACEYGAGWDSLVVSAKWDALQRAAASLGLEITDLSGKRALGRGDALRRFLSIVGDGGRNLDPAVDPDEVVRAMVGVLADGQREPRSGRAGSSTRIVNAAIDYLEATGSWFPSIIELCNVTAVSERRLRAAFVDCYEIPPSVFLRRRALSAATAELRRTPPEEATITEIAHAHGFGHLPSFARYHRETFGIVPSAARPRSRTRRERPRNSTRV